MLLYVKNYFIILLFNLGEEIDKKKRQVLKVVKHEFDHEHRLSRSFFTDCYASKTFSEKTCLSVSNTCTFRGMVQAIYQQPFGLLLFSEIQVINEI